jgi:hypothetical protein
LILKHTLQKDFQSAKETAQMGLNLSILANKEQSMFNLGPLNTVIKVMSSNADFNQETIDWLCAQSDDLTKDEGI